MPEYIDRGALLEDIDAAMENGGMGAVIAQTLKRYVKRQPAADVVPVRHGRWIVLESYRDGGTAQRCSECRELMYFYRTTPRNYCPNCGAKMDGEPT